jgi:hypothetical protein
MKPWCPGKCVFSLNTLVTPTSNRIVDIKSDKLYDIRSHRGMFYGIYAYNLKVSKVTRPALTREMLDSKLMIATLTVNNYLLMQMKRIK